MADLPPPGAFADRLDAIIDRGRAGQDIGPDLEQLAEDAGAVTAQCRGLQFWIREQRTPESP